ncbi:MAG: methionine--tRNA ligase [Dehalococcoidales bacterium]|nr:methionine--tRNA ligase [Dehalococcoidales bacterium]
MSERIFIGVAWPYANGYLHLGHVAGAYLPADIFARYHRLKGNNVLMVSGSDLHGTPITIRAEQENTTPQAVAEKDHQAFLRAWEGLGISWDLYTTTGTANHAAVTQDIFRRLKENGYIYKATTQQPYCPRCARFLPDRYVEGTCPHCGDKGARGDECEQCGKPLNAIELKDPRCRTCRSAPQFRDTEHFFFKLSAFGDRLLEWVKKQEHWRANVRNFTIGFLEEGLKDRAITRDIEWGVKVPEPGFENKRFYVWFENIIGYLSAAKQWAKEVAKDENRWQDFFVDPRAKTYYFIGKDNIVFHTINWPAELMGYGGLNLPYDVPANEFLTIESRKGSKSHNWAVWVPDYLSRYEPDPLRYMLSINMPESSDTDFSWREFVRRNNDELVATYGNLVHRVLSFTYRNFDGKVPEARDPGESSRKLLKTAEETMETVGGHLERCHFKDAIKDAMALAHAANRYLDERVPWKKIREDRAEAAGSLHTALSVIAQLKNILYPFLPFSSQKVHEYLGYTGRIESSGWKWQELPAGQRLMEPKPLFRKLDERIIEEETARIGA